MKIREFLLQVVLLLCLLLSGSASLTQKTSEDEPEKVTPIYITVRHQENTLQNGAGRIYQARGACGNAGGF